MVLLKNDGDLLPLGRGKIKTLAIIGPNAYPAVPVGGGSAQVVSFHPTGILEGVSNYLGTSSNVTYANGLMSLGRAAITTSFARSADSKAPPGLDVEVFDNET